MMNHSLAKDTALWWQFPVSVVSVSMLHIDEMLQLHKHFIIS